MSALQPGQWPRSDYSRIPNRVYHDPAIYEEEQRKIFQGPVWLYLGLEAEIPRAGDFRTCFLGEVPVVFNRAGDGTVHAFVNRCAHRGAIVRRETGGNAADHVCVYHQWSYDHSGALTGVPFARGIGGEGGMPPDFRREDHGLRRLRVESHKGILFATFSEAAEPLAGYLGETISGHLAHIMRGRVRIIGYQRQTMRGNWKLYAENGRDIYHGSLLHKFLGTFMTRTTTVGGLLMDARHRHTITYSIPEKVHRERLDDNADIVHDVGSLSDARVLRFIPEFGAGYEYGNAVCSVFPNAVVQQIRNALATRQVRPQGPDRFELFWTLFGFEDDSEELRRQRLMQVNFGGPAGFISSEDGEAVELAHKATRSGQHAASLLEMGGRGPLSEHAPSRHSEQSLRGFWSYYAELMGSAPAGAVR